jgi:hypothetical protein
MELGQAPGGERDEEAVPSPRCLYGAPWLIPASRAISRTLICPAGIRSSIARAAVRVVSGTFPWW